MRLILEPNTVENRQHVLELISNNSFIERDLDRLLVELYDRDPELGHLAAQQEALRTKNDYIKLFKKALNNSGMRSSSRTMGAGFEFRKDKDSGDLVVILTVYRRSSDPWWNEYNDVDSVSGTFLRILDYKSKGDQIFIDY